MKHRMFWIQLVGAVCALGLLAACGTPDTGAPGSQAPSPVAGSVAAEPTTIAADGVAPDAATTPGASESAALEGSAWRLVEYGPAATPIAVLAEPAVTLEFQADGNLGGSGGCNRYFATYTLDAHSFTTSGVGSTEMACLDPKQMEQEAAYLTALQSATGLQRAGDALTIHYAGGQLRFTLIVPAPPSALEGTLWQLDGLISGETASSTLAGTTTTAIFKDGTLSGSAGCNQYSARYTLAVNSLVVSEIITTKMACDAAIMRQEQEFLGALREVSSLNIEGSRLELVHPRGSLVFLANPNGTR